MSRYAQSLRPGPVAASPLHWALIAAATAALLVLGTTSASWAQAVTGTLLAR